MSNLWNIFKDWVKCLLNQEENNYVIYFNHIFVLCVFSLSFCYKEYCKNTAASFQGSSALNAVSTE